MTDDRRRRDEQRLVRAQEIAHAMRERQAELQLELRQSALRARTEPVRLASYRRAALGVMAASLPEDVS